MSKKKENVEVKEVVEEPSSATKQPNWFQRKIVPLMGKLGNQRHLAAIRDSFGTLIPLIIAGAIGILLLTIGFGGWGSENVSLLGLIFMLSHWTEYQNLADGASISTIAAWKEGPWNEISNVGVQIFSPLNSISLGMMSVYISFLMGYFLGISRSHRSPILVGFASLATWAILINVNTYFVNANGLLVAILGGIAAAELFIVFTNVRALEIRLPDGVPPAVGKSFAVFLPMLFTLTIFSLFNTGIWAIAQNQDWEVTASNVSTFSLLTLWDNPTTDISDSIHHLNEAGYYDLGATVVELGLSQPEIDAINSAESLYGLDLIDADGFITYGNILIFAAVNTDATITTDTILGWADEIWTINGGNDLYAVAHETEGVSSTIDGSLDTMRGNYDDLFVASWNVTADDNATVDQVVVTLATNFINTYENIDNADELATLNQIMASFTNVSSSLFSANASETFVSISSELFNDDNTISEKASSSVVVFHYTTIKVATSSFGAGALIFVAVQAPFMGLASSSGGIYVVLIFAFMVSFLWFFGVHGSNVMAGVFDPIWLALLATNVAIFQSVGNPDVAQELMSVYARPVIDSYMYIGGTGATIALIAGVMIFSKKRELKEVAKYAAPAGIFQINEPVTFGFPIVLNFVWFVPFVFTPLITLTWIGFGITSGLVYPAYISIPWTAPWILGAVLQNGFNSPFWSLFFAIGAFLIAFAMYFPFIMIDNMMYNKKRRESGEAAPEELALWNMKQTKKKVKEDLSIAVENGEISKEESNHLMTLALQDYKELLPILDIQYEAWKIQDELAYKEKLKIEKDEYTQLRADIKKTEKEAKLAKKEESKKTKDNSK